MGTTSNRIAKAADCVVVGASARAFAESAARAGWSVNAVDLFGDRDLCHVTATTVRLERSGYPRGLPAAIEGFPAGPCVYTGALENHPDVIAALGLARPLAGCHAEAVRGVRDPRLLAEVVRAAGLLYPDTRLTPAGVPVDGTYLVKPLASAGGRAIEPWHGDATVAARAGMCWQWFVPGVVWSAAFVGVDDAAALVGASRSVGCRRACGGRRFAYCGSIDVPLPRLPDAHRETFEAAGRGIAAAFGLRGCFGVDMIVDDRGYVHVLEVNPRPTASMELVERATGWSVAGAHLAACGWGRAPGSPRSQDVVWAKAIVRTPRRLRPRLAEIILEAAEEWTRADGMQAVADIPATDVGLPAGGPLVTVFARGPGRREAEAAVQKRVLRIRSLARADVSPPGGGSPPRRSP